MRWITFTNVYCLLCRLSIMGAKYVNIYVLIISHFNSSWRFNSTHPDWESKTLQTMRKLLGPSYCHTVLILRIVQRSNIKRSLGIMIIEHYNPLIPKIKSIVAFSRPDTFPDCCMVYIWKTSFIFGHSTHVLLWLQKDQIKFKLFNFGGLCCSG